MIVPRPDLEPRRRRRAFELMKAAREGLVVVPPGALPASPRVVLYSPVKGVYLGGFRGRALWSKLDAAGQAHAPTFADRAAALAHAESWDRPVGDLVAVAVPAAERLYASHDECVAAGLPDWGREFALAD